MTTTDQTRIAATPDTRDQPVIEARGLTKRYGSLTAVDGVDLTIYPTEIFGILGPNGAGKTTTLEMIEGLRDPDDGSITVTGIDVVHHPDDVKRRIGVQLQTTTLFEYLTVRELIALFGSLYGAESSRDWVDRLLNMVSLEEKGGDTADTLSGGQQQRLSIALALVNDPDIVFLDEPTTGLDPQARRNLWEIVEEIRDQGKTVVLTTHYMEEAETLCDRVAVMDHGQVILCDTPTRLIDTLDVNATIATGFGDDAPPIADLERLPAVNEVESNNGRVTIRTAHLQQTMTGLIDLAGRKGFELNDLRTSRPTLEDVFLHYTGRMLRE